MKRVYGTNVKTAVDSTGGFVSVDWFCPYCKGYNAGLYFSSNAEAFGGAFEIDHSCEKCGKTVTIVCTDAKELF